jgi:hypothetical protein
MVDLVSGMSKAKKPEKQDDERSVTGESGRGQPQSKTLRAFEDYLEDQLELTDEVKAEGGMQNAEPQVL